MDQDTLKKLQGVMLEIMDEFVRVCKEHNLTYFLTYGTLLGAVRHKGFIPWDDDVDVAMPRKDFEKFLDICETTDNSDYYMLSYRSLYKVGCHRMRYAKFCKKGTTYAEVHLDQNDYSGIFIDIWPLDNCYYFFVPLQTFLHKAARKLYLLKTGVDVPKGKSQRYFGKLLGCLFSVRFLDRVNKKLPLVCNKKSTRYVTFFTDNDGWKRNTFRYDKIFPLVKVVFEGKEYWAPGEWDAFLTQFYGNYMKVPPVDQQKSHDPKFVVFNA